MQPQQAVATPVAIAAAPQAVQVMQVMPEVDLPSGIDGLDVEGALRRVLGRKPLYLSMLHKFVAGQKFVVTEIRKALEGNLLDGAERLTHTLKGGAGNIGATRLQHLAEKLEAAIHERRPRKEIDDHLDAVKWPLQTLIVQLEQQLSKNSGTPAIVVDRIKLKSVCERLEALLTYDDAAVVGVLDENTEMLNTAFPNHYRVIDNRIRGYDFEAALTTLKAATRSLSPPN